MFGGGLFLFPPGAGAGDKTPAEAAGAEQVAEMYRCQASTQNHKAKEVDEDYWEGAVACILVPGSARV